MKTYIEWFSLLPSPYKEKAIKNSIQGDWIDPDKEQSESMENALAKGFCWTTSPEGEDYWNELFAKISDDSYIHNNPHLYEEES